MADPRIILEFVGSSQMKTVIKDLETVRGLTKEETKELTKLNAQAKELENSFLKGSEGAKRLDNELKKQPKTLAEMEVKLTRLKELLRDDTKLGTEGFRRVKKEVENTQKAIDKANKSLTDTKSRGDKIISTFKSVGAALGIAFGVQQIAQFGKEAIQLAATGQGIRRAFAKLNQPGLLNDLKEATRGTVTELELMKSAVRADNFRIPLEQLATYFEFATKRSIETGESVEYLTQSIVDGIGRKSTLVLDNLGISASELQEEIKKTGDFGQAAANIISRSLEETGEVADTLSTQISRLNTEWDNFKESSGQALGEVLVRLADSIGLIKENQGAIDQFRKSIEGLGRAALLDKEKDIRKELVSIRNRSLQLQRQDAVLAKEAVLLKGEELEENRRIRDEIFRQRNELVQKTKNANDFIIVLKEEAKLRKEISEESSGQEEFYNPDQLMRILDSTNELNDAQKENIVTVASLQAKLKVLDDEFRNAAVGSDVFWQKADEIKKTSEQLKNALDALKETVEGIADPGLTLMPTREIENLQIAQETLNSLNEELRKQQELLRNAPEFSKQYNDAEAEIARLKARIEEFGDTVIKTNVKVSESGVQTASDWSDAWEQELNQVLSVASGMFNGILRLQQYAIASEQKALDRQLEQGLISRETADKKRRELQRKAAEQEKAAALFKAIVNTAAAVATALTAGPISGQILAGITAALGAVEIGLIAGTPIPAYAEGVIDLDGPGTETSDSIPARLSKHESVMTAKETKKHKDALLAMRNDKWDEYLDTQLQTMLVERGLNLDNNQVNKSVVSRNEFDYQMLKKALSDAMQNKDMNTISVLDKNGMGERKRLDKLISIMENQNQPKRGGYNA